MTRTRPDPIARHLDVRSILDYVDGKDGAADRARLEDHLAMPCAMCRERVRELGVLLEHMRQDRGAAVPDAVHARALAVFQPLAPVARASGAGAILGRILFDSMEHALPATARRSVGEVRRMTVAIGAHTVELEIEPEAAGRIGLRGRLRAPDPALHRIEVVVGRERLGAWPDVNGAFALAGVPAGSVRMTIAGPAGRFRLPALS